MRHRPSSDYASARTLIAQGLSDPEVERATGIPRSTVGRWRRQGSRWHLAFHEARDDWRPAGAGTYCYLLGIYLGDGCLALRSAESARLTVTLDRGFPAIIAEVDVAMATLFAKA